MYSVCIQCNKISKSEDLHEKFFNLQPHVFTTFVHSSYYQWGWKATSLVGSLQFGSCNNCINPLVHDCMYFELVICLVITDLRQLKKSFFTWCTGSAPLYCNLCKWIHQMFDLLWPQYLVKTALSRETVIVRTNHTFGQTIFYKSYSKLWLQQCQIEILCRLICLTQVLELFATRRQIVTSCRISIAFVILGRVFTTKSWVSCMSE